MNRIKLLEIRVRRLERIFNEGAEDKEKLRSYLGDDLYTAYMAIRNRIPSEADLLRQYPKYSLAELDSDDAKFKKFLKKYIALRKSNLIAVFGEGLWHTTPDEADKEDLYRSYMDYMDMRDYVIETFKNFREFEKLKKVKINLVQKFVDSYESIGNIVAKAKEGADLIYSDGKWDVYKVKTYAASKYYGKGTRWCIAGNYEGHEERGEFYFDDYIKRKDLDGGYYFYLSKSNQDEKYCLLQRKSDGQPLSIWDASDRSLDMKYEIEDLELPKVPGVNLHDFRIDNLIALIGNEDIEGIREFLDNHEPNINLNDLNANGENAVEVAAETGNYQIVKMLLNAGLNPNIKNRNGYSALVTSVLDNEYEIEELLLKNGADPDITKDDVTPLFIAVRDAAQNNNRLRIRSIELLLKYGADPNIQEENMYRTPLFIAARWGKLELVKILAENGADVNKPTKHGNTPLDQAVKNGHTDVADYLRSVGGIQNDESDY